MVDRGEIELRVSGAAPTAVPAGATCCGWAAWALGAIHNHGPGPAVLIARQQAAKEITA